MSFDSFNLSDSVSKAIADLGYERPSDIQSETIPLLKDLDGDFVGQAQTGTGKTAAFLIPLIERMDLESRDVEALILTPTRELAQQVYEEVRKVGKYTKARATTIYGGASYSTQERALKKDRVQIVVGTPGRVIDMINRGVLKLSKCSKLIIDEADEMLNMGFMEDVQTIIDSITCKRDMWMFSATMPSAIVNLIKRKFSDPTIIRLKKKTLSNADIDQSYCLLNRRDFAKGLKLIIDNADDCYGIVFCETREETKNLSERLIQEGMSAVALHGELSQSQRDAAMKRFKTRQVSILVCTDVASRGIDVQNITHVFNMGLPRKGDAYVHRIGRTGRAGTKGKAIAFIGVNEQRRLRELESLTGQKMKAYVLPTSEEIKKNKVERELKKMDSIKGAIADPEIKFGVDATFSQFNEYFEGLSKEEILMLVFSYKFNREFRQVDDNLKMQAPTRERNRSQRAGGFRSTRDGSRGPRAGGRSGGRDGRRFSRDGNRDERRFSRDGNRDERRFSRDGNRDDSRFAKRPSGPRVAKARPERRIDRGNHNFQPSQGSNRKSKVSESQAQS